MSIKRILSVAVAVSATAALLLSCGGSKTTSSGVASGSSSGSGNYSAPQETKGGAPAKQGGTRAKRAKIECEEKAYEPNSPLREMGIGTSEDEEFATAASRTSAEENLARSLGVSVRGMMKKFKEEYKKESGKSLKGEAKLEQISYWEEFVKGARRICRDVYDESNGEITVYTTLEISPDILKNVFNKLSKDEELEIDFDMHQFEKAMAEEREIFLQNRDR
jgi:hypothetical protein